MSAGFMRSQVAVLMPHDDELEVAIDLQDFCARRAAAGVFESKVYPRAALPDRAYKRLTDFGER